MALTNKQKLFVDEYLIVLNVDRAYKTAYKNSKSNESTKVVVDSLLINEHIKQYINGSNNVLKSLGDKVLIK